MSGYTRLNPTGTAGGFSASFSNDANCTIIGTWCAVQRGKDLYDLHFKLAITANTSSATNYTPITLAPVFNALGKSSATLATSTKSKVIAYMADGNMLTSQSKAGYGLGSTVSSSGTYAGKAIGIGRIHNTSGDYGAWSVSDKASGGIYAPGMRFDIDLYGVIIT